MIMYIGSNICMKCIKYNKIFYCLLNSKKIRKIGMKLKKKSHYYIFIDPVFIYTAILYLTHMLIF